jgi:hypothetical protein
MKTDMRRELARQPFEEKIRQVARLIQLATKMKSERTTIATPRSPQKRNVDTVSVEPPRSGRVPL